MTGRTHNPVNMTTEALKAIVAHAVLTPTVEVCGFVVGRNGAGTRVVMMTNVHPTPKTNYLISDAAILEFYKTLDARGEEAIAVYHSHPNGPPILSSGREDADVDSAQDLTIPYIVVGLATGQPKVRAWRITQPFIGVRDKIEVPLHVSETGAPWTPDRPELPWALAVGNRVEITYITVQTKAPKTILATVIGGDSDGRVLLDPAMKSSVSSLPLSRVMRVKVIREGETASEMRRMAVQVLRHAASAAAAMDTHEIELLVDYVAGVFPKDIAVTVEER